MKTLKNTIETFASNAMTQEEMFFLRGGGEPQDLIIPPHYTSTSKFY
jgi:hypothetical protein